MAKVTKAKKKKDIYNVKMDKDEFDFVAGVMIDLANDVRDVRMSYGIEKALAAPTKRGRKIAVDFAHAFENVELGDYDYYDYWKVGNV